MIAGFLLLLLDARPVARRTTGMFSAGSRNLASARVVELAGTGRVIHHQFHRYERRMIHAEATRTYVRGFREVVNNVP